jgi:hypothetical protein
MAKVLAKVTRFMDLSKINTSVLEGLIKLTKKRDALLAELKKLDAAIASAYSRAKADRVPTPRGKRNAGARRTGPADAEGRAAKALSASSEGRRGALKARILAALKAAGEKGVAVKDLSAKLGVKNQNVHVWFSSTGKKVGTIQRVGAGRYRLKPGS